ncbi:MAG TPA: DUF1559 domain-containing protein [Abditibacteriaceae bacterium]|jgi:prepilin-type processing-associated H-X9-DG protein
MKNLRPLLVCLIAGVGGFMLLYAHFERSRDSARRSSCGSNLKMIGFGFQQYQADYDGHFPLVAVNSKNTVDAARDKNGYLQTSAPKFGWADAIQPYVKSTSMLHCIQELTRGGQNETSYTEPRNSDYWMNGHLSGVRPKHITNPANTFLHGDGDGRDADSTARYSKVGPPTQSYDDRQPIWTERHVGGANYSFVDGHVKWLRPNEISVASDAPYTFSPK